MVHYFKPVMTLATHVAISGAFTAISGTTSPMGTFLVSLFGHYLADTIPHWDYEVTFIEQKSHGMSLNFNFKDKKLARDVLRGVADIALGLAVAWYTFPGDATHMTVLFLGATLPDFLQGFYVIFKGPIFSLTQRVHSAFHTDRRLNGNTTPMLSQALIAGIALLVIALSKPLY